MTLWDAINSDPTQSFTPCPCMTWNLQHLGGLIAAPRGICRRGLETCRTIPRRLGVSWGRPRKFLKFQNITTWSIPIVKQESCNTWDIPNTGKFRRYLPAELCPSIVWHPFSSHDCRLRFSFLDPAGECGMIAKAFQSDAVSAFWRCGCGHVGFRLWQSPPEVGCLFLIIRRQIWFLCGSKIEAYTSL